MVAFAQCIFKQAADAGRIKVGSEYLAIDPTGEFESVEEMESLLISEPGANQQVYLGDIAQIERGYRDPARAKLRYDSKPAIGRRSVSQL